MGQPWVRSYRADPEARVIADRHYNRQSIGSAQFVPPGRCLVLLAESGDALWVTSWPLAEYVQHEWAGAWMNSCFRKEGEQLASDLIRAAVAATLAEWPTPPEQGMVSFVDPRKVRHKRDPGRCYRKAGFRLVGTTKGGLLAWQMLPDEMPDPMPCLERQLRLTDARDLDSRSRSSANGRKPLHRVDSPQVPLRNVQPGVAKLALEAVERDALARGVHRKAVPEVVRVQPPTHPASLLQLRQLPPYVGCGHVPASEFAPDHGQQRTGWDLAPDAHPGPDLAPAPFVHDDGPALITLAVADDDGPLVGPEVVLSQHEGFADPQAGSVEDHQQAPEPERGELGLAALTERDAVRQQQRELLGPDGIGRELAALVGVARLGLLRRWRRLGRGTGYVPGVRGRDNAKVSVARHGGYISLLGWGSSVSAALPLFFRCSQSTGSQRGRDRQVRGAGCAKCGGSRCRSPLLGWLLPARRNSQPARLSELLLSASVSAASVAPSWGRNER